MTDQQPDQQPPVPDRPSVGKGAEVHPSVVDDVRASLESARQQEPEEQVATYTALEETLRSSLRSAGDEPG